MQHISLKLHIEFCNWIPYDCDHNYLLIFVFNVYVHHTKNAITKILRVLLKKGNAKERELLAKNTFWESFIVLLVSSKEGLSD